MYSEASFSDSGAGSSGPGGYLSFEKTIPMSWPSNPTRPAGTIAAWRHLGCTDSSNLAWSSESVEMPESTDLGRLAKADLMTAFASATA